MSDALACHHALKQKTAHSVVRRLHGVVHDEVGTVGVGDELEEDLVLHAVDGGEIRPRDVVLLGEVPTGAGNIYFTK